MYYVINKFITKRYFFIEVLKLIKLRQTYLFVFIKISTISLDMFIRNYKNKIIKFIETCLFIKNHAELRPNSFRFFQPYNNENITHYYHYIIYSDINVLYFIYIYI